ncbi:SDR family NAD(P)-dependent oxidoreductase [candidate division KSB1 bacterium]|nr:SDR family NAD(P)-dependent oxidoreductase [candidate division KSB1 bacterium]
MNNIDDQTGRIVIVTGSNSGIGYETARVLALKNATVILAVRNLGKGSTAAQKILDQKSDASVNVMELDLANLKSVHAFAGQYLKKYKQLDLLINNAGVMLPPYTKTADGFELQIGTNHFGHFALTGLLFELISKTPNSRIINISSAMHRYGNINFNDINWEKRHYKRWNAYGDSKIANLYFTYELAHKLNQANIHTIAVAAHPGWTATELQRHSDVMQFFNSAFAQRIEMGVLPTLYAAVCPNVSSGDFFGPSGFKEMRGYPKKVDSNQLSKDQSIGWQLWDVSEKMTRIFFKI